jgi:hypothetical protein
MNPDKLAPGERSRPPRTATSRAARAAAGAPTWCRPPWPPPPPSPALRRARRPVIRLSTDPSLRLDRTEGAPTKDHHHGRQSASSPARAVPLDRSDVDTDQIIPSDWLKRVERTGFEKGLFSEWRDDRTSCSTSEQYAGRQRSWSPAPTSAPDRRASTPCGRSAVRVPGRHLAPVRRHLRNNSTKNGLVPVVVRQPRSASNCSTPSRPTPPWRSPSTSNVAARGPGTRPDRRAFPAR